MASRQRWVLTGGIGSGKTEVRRIFESLGVRTIDADSVGHEVLAGEAFEVVAGRWPETVKNGVIDRGILASIVFENTQELRELEAITHPMIFGRIETDLHQYDGLAIVEMPVTGKMEGWLTIVVDARDEVRLQRSVNRGMDREDAELRMAMQPTRAEWLATADLVIPNHGNVDDLAQTVNDAWRTIFGQVG